MEIPENTLPGYQRQLEIAAEWEAIGRPENALRHYFAALSREPGNPAVLHALAGAFLRLEDGILALRYLQKALSILPKDVSILSDIGVLHIRNGNIHAGKACFLKALRIQPENSMTGGNLSGAYALIADYLLKAGKYKPAARVLAGCLRLLGDNASIYQGLAEILNAWGTAEYAGGRPETGMKLIYRSLAIAPGNPYYFNSLGNLLRDWLKLDQALKMFTDCLYLQPDFPVVGSAVLCLAQYMDCVSEEELFRRHVEYGRHLESGRSPRLNRIKTGKDRARIGFVSPDFRGHPVGHLFAPVLECLDRRKFECLCYYSGNFEDGLTGRIRQAADKWTSLAGVHADSAAEMVAGDRIDLLIDLAGHTAGNGLDVFARRPAPVQASWLGYFYGTGLRHMDYLITDRLHLCPEAGRYLTEKPVFLPDLRFCWRPVGDTPDVAPPPVLKNGRITFGSFNNVLKLTPAMIEVWSGILRRVPDSELLIKSVMLDRLSVRERIEEMFARCGIEADRLRMRPFSAYADALKEYADVDVCLDCYPFSGCLTTLDALWMGVPVVSKYGIRPVSRQTYAILHMLGLGDSAFTSDAEYADKAVSLAQCPKCLSETRFTLRGMILDSPLCATKRFTRDLERGFEDMLG